MRKKLRKFVTTMLIGACLLNPVSTFADEIEKVDWKTNISLNVSPKVLDKMFFDKYEKEKILYTTTYLNMRLLPNIESEVEKVLPINAKVTAIADYNGWTRIVVKDKDKKNEEKYFYLWNEYLSEEKVDIKSTGGSYLGNFKLTAYCNCSSCCGKWAGGATASGTMPTAGRTVAMGGISFGTKLSINGHVYTVEDRGTPYGHVDIFFDSHSEALNFGLRYADVYVVG